MLIQTYWTNPVCIKYKDWHVKPLNRLSIRGLKISANQGSSTSLSSAV